jgi:DNA-binding response OmpR family regulator
MADRAVRVALVEDDAAIAEVVAVHLGRAGFVVRMYGEGRSLLAEEAWWPDLVVLDLMLPGMDGLEVLRRLRQRGDVPVVVLTARGEVPDRVRGLRLGADDYVIKPFDPEELLERVRTVLRRAGHLVDNRVQLEGLLVDRLAYRVHVGEHELALSRREVDLLYVLARAPNRAYTRAQLLDQVWGLEADVDERTVDGTVTRLRRKLQEGWTVPAPPPWRIETVWGVGYKLSVSPGAP